MRNKSNSGEVGKLVCVCSSVRVQGPPLCNTHLLLISDGKKYIVQRTQVGWQELQMWECQQGRSRGFRGVTGTDASSIIAPLSLSFLYLFKG